jgi:uncharacterized membrane protein YwzB
MESEFAQGALFIVVVVIAIAAFYWALFIAFENDEWHR